MAERETELFMKTQRLTIVMLALLAAFGAAACATTPTQQAENISPDENSNATPTPLRTPAGGQIATRPAGQRDDGDAFSPENVELATKQPFLVLIRKDGCDDCDRLSGAIRELSKAEPRMLFFVLNIDDPKVGADDKKVVDENAKSINVGLSDSRKSKLPYAAIFGARGAAPEARYEVRGLAQGDRGLEDAVALLSGATASTRRSSGLNKEEMNTLVKSEVARQIVELRQGLAKDPNFQKGLLEDETFKERVKSVLLADDAFKAGLAAGLAGDVDFQKQVKPDAINVKTVMAFAVLGLFPLLALALGARNLWELRRAGLKPQHPYARRRRRVFSKALKSGKGLIEGLRSDVEVIEQRVKTMEEAKTTASAEETKAEPDAEVQRAVLVTLKEIVEEAAEPSRTSEGDLKTKEAGVQLWSVIDRSVGKLRLELEPRIESLETRRQEHASSPHTAGWVTMTELDEKLGEASNALTGKINEQGTELSADIENVRVELLDKIASEMASFQTDLDFDKALGVQTGAGKENGRGAEGAGLQAAVAVAPQEDAQAAHAGAWEPERPEERAPERPAGPPAEDAGLRDELDGLRQQVGTLGTLEQRVAKLEESPTTEPTGVAELKGELGVLREQLQTAGQGDRQALENRVESLEKQLGKSRIQMLKLWKRLRQRLANRVKQAGNSLGELRESFTAQLAQQGRDGEVARRELEQKLQDLRESGEFSHLNLTNVTNVTNATSQTVAEVVRRLLDAHEAKMAAGLPADEAGRAEAARALESQRKQLREADAEVAPLVRTMTELTELAASSRKLPPEIKSKLSEFLDNAAKFGRLESLACARLETLRSNSVRSLYEKFRGHREELELQFTSGASSADKFANDGLKLLDSYSGRAADGESASAVSQEELKVWASGAEDRLMDWYSDFFQLHTRLHEARRAGGAIDDAVFQEVAGTLKVAREVLSRFDIQPEEIVIGQTLYDGRLHDFTQMRESSHPTHTIIEVLKSGFHRMRDGETIRRPKVVVAGTGAVSGAA
ncbi:MAG: hypothetical protein QOH49_406 [Acidobacteriota bacterium]|nr:hypothetical protein [Acidobacteriota bacterium]